MMKTTSGMLERAIEKFLFSSRWILTPVYVGMSLALGALGVKFSRKSFMFRPLPGPLRDA